MLTLTNLDTSPVRPALPLRENLTVWKTPSQRTFAAPHLVEIVMVVMIKINITMIKAKIRMTVVMLMTLTILQSQVRFLPIMTSSVVGKSGKM